MRTVAAVASFLLLLVALTGIRFLPLTSRFRPETLAPSVLLYEDPDMYGSATVVQCVKAEDGSWTLLLLTARHVAEAVHPANTLALWDWTVVALSEREDAALVSVRSTEPHPALPTRTTPLRAGERLYSAGYGTGFGLWLEEGIASAEDRVSVYTCHGDSGSPVVDLDGRVVGVRISLAENQNQRCLIAPVAHLWAWMDGHWLR